MTTVVRALATGTATVAVTVAVTVTGAVAAPALASIGPARRLFLPRLSGIGRPDHLALTYDDGPDPVSTPHFLDLLDRHGRTATFFLLGAHVARHPALVAEMAERGHELAVHGWEHDCVLAVRPGRLAAQLRDTVAVIEDTTGRRPRWYRPPYGVLSTPALGAARASGLRTVLWSAWGRDWEARATPERIVRTVGRTLAPGGTVLLHDTDRTSAPGSWHHTLEASGLLLESWAGSGVGPLAEHGV